MKVVNIERYLYLCKDKFLDLHSCHYQLIIFVK